MAIITNAVITQGRAGFIGAMSPIQVDKIHPAVPVVNASAGRYKSVLGVSQPITAFR